MITYFVAFLCALMVGAFLTLVVRNRAHQWGLVDRVNSSRKIHAKPIPRLGGVAIVLAFFVPITALLFIDSSVGQTFRSETKLVWGLFGGGLVISALGLWDDLKGTGAFKKFTVQFAVALLLYLLGFRVEHLANPFGPPVSLGFFSLPVTLLWIVGVVNAMNLIDGLDGLAGGVAFFSIGTNFILAFARGDQLMALTMAALAGAVLGFLVYNFNPASIFMGDTGSMFLGFVLATVSLKTSAKSGTAVAMLVPIIALGLPIMDTLLAVVRRTLLGRPVFSADKEHIHHRLMSRLVLSHRRAVLFLYGLCCLFALTALGLAYANSAQTAMLLSGVGIVVLVLMRKLGYLNLRQATAAGQTRRKNHQLRQVIKQLNDQIGQARSITAIWEAIKPLAETLDTERMELRIVQHDGALSDGVSFETRRPSRNAFPLDLRIDIPGRDQPLGFLALTWTDGRGEVDRDEELAIEVVADSVAKAVARAQQIQSADPQKVVALRK